MLRNELENTQAIYWYPCIWNKKSFISEAKKDTAIDSNMWAWSWISGFEIVLKTKADLKYYKTTGHIMDMGIGIKQFTPKWKLNLEVFHSLTTICLRKNL